MREAQVQNDGLRNVPRRTEEVSSTPDMEDGRSWEHPVRDKNDNEGQVCGRRVAREQDKTEVRTSVKGPLVKRISVTEKESLSDSNTDNMRTSTIKAADRQWGKSKKLPFPFIMAAQFLCVVYILSLTFMNLESYSSGDMEGLIAVENEDPRPVAAQDEFELCCLIIARISAWAMYPPLIFVFLSQCKALRGFLQKSPLSLFVDLRFHERHVYSGTFIAFAVYLHTVAHLLRWGYQNNMQLLWTTRTGGSGLVAFASAQLVALPMMCWRKRIRYEIRKAMHYFFYVFAVALCFHVPTNAIPNGGFLAPIVGACITLYTLDRFYVFFFMTEQIETTTFQVLPSGVQMSMNVSEAFNSRIQKGGYGYVCLPWVDRTQWHPFSLYESPLAPRRREVFILKSGDWTSAVHSSLQRNTVRPAWIQGPFVTPFNNAILYDNHILVATGIGITPALSIIRAHRNSRRINLIWLVRDANMMEFFLEHLSQDHSGWNLIFYTGKDALNPMIENVNTSVRVIKSRPDLAVVVPNIIYGIENKSGLPENYSPSELQRVARMLIHRTDELDRVTNLSSKDKLHDLISLARRQGFLFTALLHQLEDLQLEKVTDVENCTQSFKKSDMHISGAAAEIGFATPSLGGGICGISEDDAVLEKIRRLRSSLTSSMQHEIISSTSGSLERDNDFLSTAIQPESAQGTKCNLRHDPMTLSVLGHENAAIAVGNGRIWDEAISEDSIMKEQAVLSRRKILEVVSSLNSNEMEGRVEAAPYRVLSGDHPRLSKLSLTSFRKQMPTIDVQHLDSTFKPWVPNVAAQGFVRGLGEDVLSTWSVMYCGGNTPVERTLRSISNEYKLSLDVESFSW